MDADKRVLSLAGCRNVIFNFVWCLTQKYHTQVHPSGNYHLIIVTPEQGVKFEARLAGLPTFHLLFVELFELHPLLQVFVNSIPKKPYPLPR